MLPVAVAERHRPQARPRPDRRAWPSSGSSGSSSRRRTAAPGLDFVAEALACEEIERGEAAFRTLISVHVGLNSLSLLRYGTEEQKQRWLAPQAKGEKLACFGLTEPGAGSDVAALRTTARREGDAYVLNGQKNWISYASVADHALVFAKTDPGAAHKGISAFLLEKGTPGFTARDTEHKLGIWAGSTGELFFENVEVPAENRLGEEGQGFEIAMYALDQGRFTVAAGACGVIRACLERSTAYARERRDVRRRRSAAYQFVQDMIATMVLGYETSKLLVMQAAWMKDEGRRSTRETSLAKWHATESAFEAAHLAVQVFGSYGYSAEVGIERYFRNARAPIIYEGTTQIHKLMQAEHALGYRRAERRGGEVSPLCSWAPALSPVHARGLELAVPVVDRVREAEELAQRPDADLAAVGVDRDRRSPPCSRASAIRTSSVAAVRHLVRAVGPSGKRRRPPARARARRRGRGASAGPTRTRSHSSSGARSGTGTRSRPASSSYTEAPSAEAPIAGRTAPSARLVPRRIGRRRPRPDLVEVDAATRPPSSRPRRRGGRSSRAAVAPTLPLSG